MNTRTILCAASCLCAIASLHSPARAERFIDTFAAPLPQQTLPGTSSPAPILWVGTVSAASRWQDAKEQSGLPGVLGGERDTTLMASTLSNLVTLSSTQASGKSALSYATGSDSSGHLLLEYGADVDLHANLIADGSVAFELEIVGDMDNSLPHRPVALTVSVASGSSPPVAAQVTLTADGVYQVPFTSFPGVNFADVNYVSFDFDASSVSAVDYTLIGGLRTTRCLQPSGSAVADIVLDAFATPLPLDYLPGAGQVPVLWAGTWSGTVKASDTASQSNAFGGITAQRDTRVDASGSSLSNFISASMSSVSGTPALSYATGNPTSGTLRLMYGAQTSLDADLSRAVAFELELAGDLDSSPPRPVPLTVTVVSGAVTRSRTVTLVNDGMVYVPFSEFPLISFHDVDRVTFLFDASQVQAVDYSLIGGLRASACMP